MQPLADILCVASVVQDLSDQAQILTDRAEHSSATERIIEAAPRFSDPFKIVNHSMIRSLTVVSRNGERASARLPPRGCQGDRLVESA